MVCREARVGSAVTSYVLQTTTLEEQQVLSLYHEVMREGRHAATPTDHQSSLLITRLATQIHRDPHLAAHRRQSILTRLDRARTESMTGQRFYATQRLAERAEQAEAALAAYVTDAARDLGVSETEVRTQITTARATAATDRSLRPAAGFLDRMRNDPATAGLPLDRQTAVAIEQVEAARQAARAAQPTRATVAREQIFGFSAIAEMGYDAATGRVEVVLHSNPEVVYAYRMSGVEYERFRRAGSLGSYYARNVRGNDAYRYADTQTADEAATQTQCATCGQFAGAGHACPPRNSVEERNRTERRARQATRRRAETRATPLTHADEEAYRADDEALESLRRSGTQRRYTGASGSFRTIGLTEVQQTARRHRAGVTIPITATIVRYAGEEGARECDEYGAVSGTVQVTYNGRGRGYTAVAATTPGDTGTDQLRCACADYRRTYDCVHVRQTVQDLNTRLNQSSLRERHGIGEAIEQVTGELAQDHAESVAAQTESRTTWTPGPVSYTNNPAAFQRDYRAAKDREAAGEQPVPFMLSNATDGLGARGTGRAFGVELEFDIDPGVDRYTALRNIGRELHAAGLTSSAQQRGYHASGSRGYTENHRGGWSFEQDCTVAGEIVSPIMYDEPETWQNLQTVCEIIRRNGGTISTGAGSHVHVSAHNYDHTVENHNRLLGAFAENEDTIYRLSSSPERGRHRGARWCAPNRVPATGYANVQDACYRNNSHNIGLNLQSVTGRDSDHVEFRTFDATLEPAIIQTQIKMSLALTESAFRDRDYTPGAHTPMGSHRSHNRAEHGASRRLTGEAWRQDTAGYRAFADRLFRRPEDKAQLTALFAITRWQRGGAR